MRSDLYDFGGIGFEEALNSAVGACEARGKFSMLDVRGQGEWALNLTEREKEILGVACDAVLAAMAPQPDNP